ncbi:MAG: diguanylate cyclase [Clostridiaceae bacterium]
MKIKKIASYIFILLVLFGIILFNRTSISNFDYRSKYVKFGVVELNNINLNKNIINLSGDWEFYPHEFFDSKDFQQNKNASYISVPYLWNGQVVNNEIIDGMGYGTYRLNVLLDEDNVGDVLALRVKDVCTSYVLMINGEKYDGNGTIGRNKDEAFPNNQPKIINFTPNTRKIEIIIQVSNYSQKGGGIWSDVELSSLDNLMNRNNKDLSVSFILFGAIFIVSIYNLINYFFIRKDKSYLYFAFVCFVLSLRNMAIGGREILYNNLKLNYFVISKIEYVTMPLMLYFFIKYFRIIFSNKMNEKLFNIIEKILIGYSLFILFVPSSIYTYTLSVFQITVVIASLLILISLIKVVKNKEEGIDIFVMGAFSIVVTLIHDILVSLEILDGNFILPYGILIFIIFQSMVVSKRFSVAYSDLEIYLNENKKMYKNIKKLNLDLEKKVEERTKELISKNNQLKHMACTDSLTNIYNHGSILNILETEIEKANDLGENLSVSVMDIDFFKKVNDNYGHQFGDKTLVEIVEIIKNNLREVDFLGRYGGEEFLIILKGANIEIAYDICDRIRKKVEEKTIENLGVKITISGGLVELTDENLVELVNEADKRLYKAKDSGRNMIVKK